MSKKQEPVINTISVNALVDGVVPMTKEEYKAFLKRYEEKNPEKYASKLARGEFDKFAAKLK